MCRSASLNTHKSIFFSKHNELRAIFRRKVREKQKKVTVLEAVVVDDALGYFDDARALDADDLARARLCREHAEDAGAAADVEHHLVAEQVAILAHGVAVRARPHLVLEQLCLFISI